MAIFGHETDLRRKANASICYLREYYDLPVPERIDVLCEDGSFRKESVVDESRAARLGFGLTSFFVSSMVAKEFNPNDPESVSTAGYMTVIQTERALGSTKGLI